MKTRVIAHRSLLWGTLEIMATLALLAFALVAPARAGVRVAAQVGPVAVDYRDAGPGRDAQARVVLAPVAARVLVGRPDCGPDRGACTVAVVDPCRRHDRDHDGRCDRCERRDHRHGRRGDHDGHRRGGDDYREVGGILAGTGLGRACEHTDRCEACRHLEIGTCRDHHGLYWVAGHHETVRGPRGRTRSVWVEGHWERPGVACR